jgi:hypothetical protein
MEEMTLASTGKARDDPRPEGASRPATGMRRYAREIVIVLIVKTIALVAIWDIWFSGPGRKGVSADRVAERLYPFNPPATPQGGPHARP